MPKVTRAPRAPKPTLTAEGFSRFDDPEVISARARVEAAKEAYRQTRKGNQEIIDASEALEEVYKRARARIDDRIAAMTPAQAKRTLVVVKQRLRTAAIERTRADNRRAFVLRELNAAPGPEKAAISVRYSEAALEASRTAIAATELEESVLALGYRLPLKDRLPFRAARYRAGSSERRVHETFSSTVEAVEDTLADTGLRSRWTGRTFVKDKLTDADNAAGVFTWDNGVGVSTLASTYSEANLAKVLLHEALHSVSPKLRSGDYLGHRGWEEGVVEGATKVLEARIRDRLGLPAARGYTTYHEYTAPLEDFQAALGKSDDDFWLGLLRTPLPDRPALLDRWVGEAPGRAQPALRRYRRGIDKALNT